MPRHAHKIQATIANYAGWPRNNNYPNDYVLNFQYIENSALSHLELNNSTTGLASHLDYQGNGLAHNNMPPYIAAYCWKRIS